MYCTALCERQQHSFLTERHEPPTGMSSSPISMAAAGAATMAAAMALGYLWGRRESASTKAMLTAAPDHVGSRSALCACGASLEGFSDNARNNHLASARHRRNLRLISRRAALVVAENWSEYRSCIAHCISGTDTVLEVGCGNGVTTSPWAWLHRRVAPAVLAQTLFRVRTQRRPWR